jgi:hypothetical protein
MARWTKKAAISRMENNSLLQQALDLEPKLKPIIEEARDQRNKRGYDRIRKYIELRNRTSKFVGWLAEDEKLRTTEFYDVVRETIDDLLPPDKSDLHPDG